MKPNFHAIGAIVYGLRFGFTGIPTFLRRGWLALLISVGSAYGLFSFVMSEAHLETLQGNFGFGFTAPFEQLIDTVVTSDGYNDVELVIDEGDGEFIGNVLLFYFAQLVALVLMIPAFVDLYRKAAGLEPRPGFLPGFGAPEWSLLFASLLLIFIATPLFYILLAVPAGGLIAAGVIMEQPIAFVLAGAVAFLGLLWWHTRSGYIPIHAALVGRLAFFEGFGLTGGRFWKLVGTHILMMIVIVAITFAVSILGLALDLTQVFGISLVLNAFLNIYLYTAMAGTYGRITGELMGIVEDSEFGPEAGEDEADLAEGVADMAEDWSGDASAQPEQTMAAEPAAADSRPVMMQRAAEPRTGFTGETADEPEATFGADAPAEAAPSPGPQGRRSVQFLRRRFRG